MCEVTVPGHYIQTAYFTQPAADYLLATRTGCTKGRPAIALWLSTPHTVRGTPGRPRSTQPAPRPSAASRRSVSRRTTEIVPVRRSAKTPKRQSYSVRPTKPSRGSTWATVPYRYLRNHSSAVRAPPHPLSRPLFGCDYLSRPSPCTRESCDVAQTTADYESVSRAHPFQSVNLMRDLPLP